MNLRTSEPSDYWADNAELWLWIPHTAHCIFTMQSFATCQVELQHLVQMSYSAKRLSVLKESGAESFTVINTMVCLMLMATNIVIVVNHHIRFFLNVLHSWVLTTCERKGRTISYNYFTQISKDCHRNERGGNSTQNMVQLVITW